MQIRDLPEKLDRLESISKLQDLRNIKLRSLLRSLDAYHGSLKEEAALRFLSLGGKLFLSTICPFGGCVSECHELGQVLCEVDNFLSMCQQLAEVISVGASTLDAFKACNERVLGFLAANAEGAALIQELIEFNRVDAQLRYAQGDVDSEVHVCIELHSIYSNIQRNADLVNCLADSARNAIAPGVAQYHEVNEHDAAEYQRLRKSHSERKLVDMQSSLHRSQHHCCLGNDKH